MQALQHQGGAVGVQLQDPLVEHLVADLGAGAAAAGAARRRHQLAVLGDPQERGTQAAPAEQLVGVGRG